MEKQCSLYRHFDKDGKLLYVGISKCAIKRFRSHEKGSAWSKDIATIKIEWFDSVSNAMEAERIAIINEKPVWNIHHNRVNNYKSPPLNLNRSHSVEDISYRRNKIYIDNRGPFVKSKIALEVLGFKNMADYKDQYIIDYTLPPFFRFTKTTYMFKENHLRIYKNRRNTNEH